MAVGTESSSSFALVADFDGFGVPLRWPSGKLGTAGSTGAVVPLADFSSTGLPFRSGDATPLAG
jgi:hypothetical protein